VTSCRHPVSPELVRSDGSRSEPPDLVQTGSGYPAEPTSTMPRQLNTKRSEQRRVCPILAWLRVSYVGVRATVATACGAQSMMSPDRAPGRGLRRRFGQGTVDRREFDAADVGLGSETNARGAQRHGGDWPWWPCPRDTTSNSPPSGRPKMLSRPYLAIRFTLANTRLSYSSRRPSDRTISAGVIGVTVRGTERSSAIDPFRSFLARSSSTAAAQAPT
jgi:hypothetical protein